MAEDKSARTGLTSVAKCQKGTTSICQGCIFVYWLSETPRLILLQAGIQFWIAVDGELRNGEAGSARDTHAVR